VVAPALDLPPLRRRSASLLVRALSPVVEEVVASEPLEDEGEMVEQFDEELAALCAPAVEEAQVDTDIFDVVTPADILAMTRRHEFVSRMRAYGVEVDDDVPKVDDGGDLVLSDGES
jgi:hypothetical protein